MYRQTMKEEHKDPSSREESEHLVLTDDEADVRQDDDSALGDGGSNQHTLKLASTIAIKSEVFCLAFSEDGRFLIACCGDGLVRVFNPNTGATISVLISTVSKNRVKNSDHDGENDGGGETKGNSDGVDNNYTTTRRRDNRIRRSSGSSYSAEASAATAAAVVTTSSVSSVQMPCTCAVFRPRGKRKEKTRGVALVGYSRGEIQLWHVPSAKLLHSQEIDQQGGVENLAQHIRSSLTVSEREDSCQPPLLGVEVLCCAYAADGDIFAIGASDGVVRIYADDANKALLAKLKPGLGKRSGHSNRIFSVKFHPDDSNVIVSGGWDNCVHVWNVARREPTHTVFGPHVCGDAVGVVGNTILTGSWRDEAQLETWNMDTAKRDGPAFWSGFGSTSSAGVLHGGAVARRCRLYAAVFGGPEGCEGRFVAAGGGNGANEVKVFDFEHDKRLIGSLLGLSSGAISLAFGDEGSRLAVGLANGLIHLVDIIPVPRTSNNCSASITETITSSLQQGGKTIMF